MSVPASTPRVGEFPAGATGADGGKIGLEEEEFRLRALISVSARRA